jgi:polyisoprenoid-binding protein YceI
MVDFLHAPYGLRVAAGRWTLDPTRSSVEFRVPHFFGLITVKGRFTRFDGSLDLRGETPMATLTVHSASLDTGHRRRDEHLRSGDFFAVDRHPQVWFVSDEATLDGPRLLLSGALHAAGRHTRVTTEATLLDQGDELEIAATAHVDQRALGMTWSPMGMVHTPAELTLRGRLVRADA